MGRLAVSHAPLRVVATAIPLHPFAAMAACVLGRAGDAAAGGTHQARAAFGA
jgi:hypothetical protein